MKPQFLLSSPEKWRPGWSLSLPPQNTELCLVVNIWEHWLVLILNFSWRIFVCWLYRWLLPLIIVRGQQRQPATVTGASIARWFVRFKLNPATSLTQLTLEMSDVFRIQSLKKTEKLCINHIPFFCNFLTSTRSVEGPSKTVCFRIRVNSAWNMSCLALGHSINGLVFYTNWLICYLKLWVIFSI